MTPLKILINGLPGNVAGIITKHILEDERFEVLPYSLTGPEITTSSHTIGSAEFALIRPENADAAIKALIKDHAPFICVDYTHPSAVNNNATLYCANNLPFVMGTTGGDRDKLTQTVLASSVSAVISPNMAKQIVGFQAMMAYAAETFPGLFEGFELTIRESHQQGKADTSGTAVAMVGYFNQLGVPIQKEDIRKERDPEIQKSLWGIPEPYLGGHAWHTYTLISQDKTAKFEFTHNINGRDIYAQGTMDAVLFLNKKIQSGSKGEIFSMVDILKGSDA